MHWGRQIAYPNGWFPTPIPPSAPVPPAHALPQWLVSCPNASRWKAEAARGPFWRLYRVAFGRPGPGAARHGLFSQRYRHDGAHFRSGTSAFTALPRFASVITLLAFSQEVQRAVCVGFLRGFPAEAFAWSLVELIVHLLDPRGVDAVQWGPGGGAPRAAGRWCSHWCRAARGSGPGRSRWGRPVVLEGRDPGANSWPRSTVRGRRCGGPGPAR